jgi:hypothetical protein
VNKVILNWLRPLWEGDKEVVKRSGRHEPMWIVIHICMEAMLGIFLYSYLYLNVAKIYVFLIISYIFSSTKLEKNRVEYILLISGGCGGRWPKQCIHMSVNVKMMKLKKKKSQRKLPCEDYKVMGRK